MKKQINITELAHKLSPVQMTHLIQECMEVDMEFFVSGKKIRRPIVVNWNINKLAKVARRRK